MRSTTFLCDPTSLDHLLVRVSSGNGDAFGELYVATLARTAAVVTRCLVDWAQSEEVVQDVYLEVWQNASKSDPTIGSAVAWILMIAHRRAIDRVRASQASRTRDITIGMRDWNDVFDTVEAAVETTADYTQAMKALSSMTERHREVIRLAYIEGLSPTEIAGILHLTLNTVKGRLRRGLECLRQEMTTPSGPLPQPAMNASGSGRHSNNTRRSSYSSYSDRCNHSDEVTARASRGESITRQRPGLLIG
jgi:RNA polymerase sigma-70 factor (ECF subfamily)